MSVLVIAESIPEGGGDVDRLSDGGRQLHHGCVEFGTTAGNVEARQLRRSGGIRVGPA
ncbi:hypothetical protein ACFWP5_51715 [Streptomyces sp. NPDC058469]|uniref:hypothetical protein n=1 Tax=Streptomyces sp. NPDC058469 TaxID=3346514 RepID=UPI003668EF04